MKKKLVYFSLLILLFTFVGINLGINIEEFIFRTPMVSFESEKGVQSLTQSTPIFKDKSYKSEILGFMSPQKVKVLYVSKGWRLIESEYGFYWLPPSEVFYDRSESVLMDVPIINQFPELRNGCEAVAALMMLRKFGVDTDKEKFSHSIPKDDTPLEKRGNDVTVWGDPEKGFVGDITGRAPGYSIDPKPLKRFLEKYVEKPVDLTGVEPEILERYLRAGNPVVTWTTVNFKDLDSYDTWVTPSKKVINATFNTHAMTMTGFDDKYYYLNDPYTGTKNYRVTKQRFLEVWNSLGKKAISLE